MRANPKTTVALLTIFLWFLPLSHSQQPNTTGYTCNPSAAYPCRAYAFYRASAPNFLDLASVGDLFALSRPVIAAASNISSPAAALSPGQALLLPLSCSCNHLPVLNASSPNVSLSYAPLNYTIRAGDTFYLLSTLSYQNLTTYQSVEAVNPTLVVTDLDIGTNTVFPIFCRCPNRTAAGAAPGYLISYVLQPADTVASLATSFGTNPQSILSANGGRLPGPFETIFIPVTRLPVLSQPTVSTPPQAPPPPPPQVAGPRKVERKGLIVGLAVGLGICGVLLVLILGMWGYRESEMGRREREEKEEKAMAVGFGEKSDTVGRSAKDLGMDVSECLDKYRVFKIEELKEATGDFDERCLIQGSVYRGSIKGETYAIKKMKWNAYEELKILQKVNHGNLVRLEGFCIDQEDANCYLVYEYVENGSLHSWLHGGRDQKLSWKSRLRIAVDVANGLQYIHEHTRPRVVHKDVKSSNILLDVSMRAKIANFGLAKSGCNAITMHIVGTQGYIAPEYLADGVISTKMDVFSFGVILLELISGREAIDEEGRVLWASAARVLEGSEDEKVNKLKDWMDADLVEETGSIESVMKVMTVAVACLHKDPSKRPSMVDIVYALCKSDEDVFLDISEDDFTNSTVVAR